MKTIPKNARVELLTERPLIFTGYGDTSVVQKVGEVSLHVFGLTLWLYMWKFLLAILGWYAGFNLVEYELTHGDGLRGLEDFLLNMAPYGAAFCVILCIWAGFNAWRFRTEKRGQAVRLPSIEQDCKWTSVSPEDLMVARAKKNLLCKHSSNGELISVTAIDHIERR